MPSQILIPKLTFGLFVLFLCASFQAFGQKVSNIELSLDKTVLDLPCRRPFPAKYRTCPDGMTINVSVKSPANAGRNPRYVYSVSGGIIVGDGANVIWDMSKSMPGTYVITATVGSGKTKKFAEKSIKVEECPDCTMECLECPRDVLKSSKDEVVPGEIVEINLIGKLGPKYNWVVLGGTIVEGQETDRIKIVIDAQTSRSTLLITLNVLDEFCFEVWRCPPPQIELPIVQKY